MARPYGGWASDNGLAQSENQGAFHCGCAERVRWLPRFGQINCGFSLLTNAELTEDAVQQILGAGLADDFAHGIGSDPQIHGGEFEGRFVSQRII